MRLKDIEEMTEMYYNSNQFRYTLGFLVHQFSSPFRMFERLADFFREEGYFLNSPARAYRYQVLLSFACREGKPEYEEIYKQLLTYDLYLRENVKSRPGFAGDLSPYKEEIREFFRREEEERRYLPGYEGMDHKQMEKNAHMEVFRYPVWDEELWKKMAEGGPKGAALSGKAETPKEEMWWVLFNYQKRNPLTGDAQVTPGLAWHRKKD